ncbi:hypothetical protein FSP39_000511 [Pinctada imbricata]|uniref:Uncharacterized protein n=1 Tax=Pinctada imbricata TaxID=66713 RepID=A0AA89C7Q0_PINIB|nr:hypothetical protein FSP39_000511 [Pinctada imbricata]
MRTSRDVSSYPRENGVSVGRRSSDRLPIYDRRELDSSIDEIDIMLPGVCLSPRPPSVRPSTKMRPSRTSTCCSCCSLCDTPKSQLFQTMTPFELQHPDIYKREKTKVLPHCAFCQGDEMKKNLVQYCHGDVIKTFDWLMKDAKETPL